ncbi:MAG: Mur ligase family protein [Devosia sp.]
MKTIARLRSQLYEHRVILGKRWHDRLSALIEPFERTQAVRKQQALVGTYIAITGSSGKSTTSMLISRFLAREGSVAAGVKANTRRWTLRTLRRLRAATDYVVQEVSAHNGPGAIGSLLAGIRIDVAVVTSVGKEHWSAFRDIEAIAKEKSWIVGEASTLACLNADDPRVRAMKSVARGRVVTFGTSRDAEVRAEAVDVQWPGRLSFDVVIGETRRRVATQFVGPIMLTNVLGALSVVHGLGLDVDKAVAEIATIEPIYEHSSVHEAASGHTYLLDTDKAPLWNTERLIADLPGLGAERTVLVLGQMSDKGGNPSQKYRRVLRNASKAATEVLALGQAAEQVGRDPLPNVRAMGNVLDVATYLKSQPASLVVLKAGANSKLTRIFLRETQPVTCKRVTCGLKISCRSCALLAAEG